MGFNSPRRPQQISVSTGSGSVTLLAINSISSDYFKPSSSGSGLRGSGSTTMTPRLSLSWKRGTSLKLIRSVLVHEMLSVEKTLY